MSDISLSSVSWADPNERVAQPENSPEAASQAQKSQAQPEAAKVEAGGSNADQMLHSANDVTIKFKIDEKTQDVTVYLLDRASRKVVRTIPPEEISRLNPGDLLELFA